MADDAYRVEGDIIDVTSVGLNDDDAAEIRRPVTLNVKRFDGRWLIDAVEPGDGSPLQTPDAE